MPASRLHALHRTLGIPPDYGRARRLMRYREPDVAQLVQVGRHPVEGRPVRLTKPAASAWRQMRNAAAQDGVVLFPLSGFRSVARQTRLIRMNLAKGRTLDDILRYIAAPGYSEHHTGRAIDVGSPDDVSVEEKFGRTPAFRWLRRHAGKYGFVMSFPRRNPHGIGYEPWHWCWRR
ncbi:MAG: M15 family metallopeptidase [Opitutaceae bacterium]